MEWLIGSVAFVSGLWISLNYVDKVKVQLQGQINYLAQENHELTLRVIELEGKTIGHEIRLNSVECKTNLNEIELKYSKARLRGEA